LGKEKIQKDGEIDMITWLYTLSALLLGWGVYWSFKKGKNKE